MTVYFYDHKSDPAICSIEYDGSPSFKVGEKITLQVNNNVPDKWDVDPIPFSSFEITEISHHALKYYGSSVNYQFSMFVILKRLSPTPKQDN